MAVPAAAEHRVLPADPAAWPPAFVRALEARNVANAAALPDDAAACTTPHEMLLLLQSREVAQRLELWHQARTPAAKRAMAGTIRQLVPVLYGRTFCKRCQENYLLDTLRDILSPPRHRGQRPYPWPTRLRQWKLASRRWAVEDWCQECSELRAGLDKRGEVPKAWLDWAPRVFQ